MKRWLVAPLLLCLAVGSLMLLMNRPAVREDAPVAPVRWPPSVDQMAEIAVSRTWMLRRSDRVVAIDSLFATAGDVAERYGIVLEGNSDQPVGVVVLREWPRYSMYDGPSPENAPASPLRPTHLLAVVYQPPGANYENVRYAIVPGAVASAVPYLLYARVDLEWY